MRPRHLIRAVERRTARVIEGGHIAVVAYHSDLGFFLKGELYERAPGGTKKRQIHRRGKVKT